MRRNHLALAVIAATAAMLLTPTPGYATDSAPTPSWGPCPGVPGVDHDPRQQCATLRVPLDHRKPDGRKIDLAISRIPAAKPSLRRGILLSNPGGPGVEGLNMPSALAGALPTAVSDRYDLVGFDPRGVGHSTPVTCGMPADLPIDLVIPFPAADGSIDRNVAFARKVANDCAARSGDLLPYITTANTARDMDVIRGALHERTLSYLGGSYGTYLGAVYTTLFPQRSDRIVLDSAVDPKLVWYDQWRAWNTGFALRFPDFTTWAAAHDPTYHLGSTPEAVARTYDDLTARLDKDPTSLPDGRVVDGNTLRAFTFSELYSDYAFPELAESWQSLAGRGGSPAGLTALRTASGPARPATAEVPADNLRAAQLAVVCDDPSWSRDVATYANNVAVDRRLYPRTAGFPANVWPCVFWKNQPVEAPVAVTGKGPRNVLILQNLRDPATPWATGYGMRQALGQRAAMVSVDQGGHGVYMANDAPCANDITTAFLTDGVLPAHDRLCAGQPPSDLNAKRSAPRLVPQSPLR
jgi:pimeloyl-ACP methyl ester carboxylesterase